MRGPVSNNTSVAGTSESSASRARREGLRVGARDYFRTGALVGLPAFALATLTFLLTR